MLLLAACSALPAGAWAARPVPVLQVDVGGQTVPDLQQAMRAALVRATGRRESAADPAFGGLIADAAKYVQGYDRGPQGELQVTFNAVAVDQAIAALGRSVWDPNRPFTLVVIYPPPDQADQGTDQAELEQAAEQRGLPISIVPLPVTDESGNLLSREALLEMAHRYGAEELLLGRPPAGGEVPPGGTGPGAAGAPPAVPPAAPGSAGAASPSPPAPQTGTGGTVLLPGAAEAWQWTLYTDFTSQTWTGPLTAGIDDTVDLLAPPSGPASANALAQTQIEIDGVSSLADYANIELMLAAVPGVSAANVREVSGDTVVFDLTVRGGADAVRRQLSSSPRFTPIGSITPAGGAAAQGGGASGAALVFRYRSG